MADPARVDLEPLRKALAVLAEALELWQAQPETSVLKRHLRSAVIQSFEFSYELAVRSLRRVLLERASSTEHRADISFNELLRAAADAGLLADPVGWRVWRELRNATSHAYDEAKAEAVARDARGFCADGESLLQALEAAS